MLWRLLITVSLIPCARSFAPPLRLKLSNVATTNAPLRMSLSDVVATSAALKSTLTTAFRTNVDAEALVIDPLIDALADACVPFEASSLGGGLWAVACE